MDPTSHSLSPKVEGCTNIFYGSNGNPTMQSHLQQKKNMRKNGNWDNASLKLVMESIEVGSNLHIVVHKWGVPTTLLHNCVYGIKHNQEKEGKQVCRRKKKNYINGVCEKMQLIGHPMTSRDN
jgi:hypothetical protein